MRKEIIWLWTIGFFGLLAAADAQTASPPAANTQFDGTYAFVSATTVNETFMGEEQDRAIARSGRQSHSLLCRVTPGIPATALMGQPG
jgi:hypothetical protein